MSSLTNRISLTRRAFGQNKPKNKSKVGIIFTGEFPVLDEHLVEAEVASNFDINKIEEIISVGKKEKTFKFANRFAKKHNLPIEAYPLEDYTFEDVDYYIKRNANICYNSDSVIIIHGDKEYNFIAWYALTIATRINSKQGKVIFINKTQSPEFIGLEKDIHELLQQPYKFAFDNKNSSMEQTFYELMENERDIFIEYIQKAQKINFKQILYNITNVHLYGGNPDYYDGYASVTQELIYAMIWFYKRDLFNENGSPKTEEIEQYIKKEINPDFYYRNEDEDDICWVMFHNNWYKYEYLMLDIIPKYDYRFRVVDFYDSNLTTNMVLKSDKGDEETCAALCYGQWIAFKYYRGVENTNIND